MIRHFMEGLSQNPCEAELVKLSDIDLKFCTGCLRCNMLGKCSLSGDEWNRLVEKMDAADVIVFASPIYFHHLTAQMKKFIDRFRSLVKIRITENGLIHSPVKVWNKEIVLMFTMGTPDDVDAKPAIELFHFIAEFLNSGKENHMLLGRRLAVTKQIDMNQEELEVLYQKLGLKKETAELDFHRNQKLISECVQLGAQLSR